MMAHRYRHENFLSHVIPFHHLMLLFISYYSRTCLLGHLYSGYSSIQGHKIWSRKNVHIIFVFVTSIEGIPLFRGKGHFSWVPKPRFNLHSRDTWPQKSLRYTCSSYGPWFSLWMLSSKFLFLLSAKSGKRLKIKRKISMAYKKR